jgi:hypothetical protein
MPGTTYRDSTLACAASGQGTEHSGAGPRHLATLYVFVDDTVKQLLPRRHHRVPRGKLSESEVVTLAMLSQWKQEPARQARCSRRRGPGLTEGERDQDEQGQHHSSLTCKRWRHSRYWWRTLTRSCPRRLSGRDARMLTAAFWLAAFPQATRSPGQYSSNFCPPGIGLLELGSALSRAGRLLRNQVWTVVVTGFGQMHFVAYPGCGALFGVMCIAIIGRADKLLSRRNIARAAPGKLAIKRGAVVRNRGS